MLLFQTVGKDAFDWRLRQKQIDEWQTIYPGLDVLAECRKAWAWVQANPGRRKTVRGMPKFLNGWLSRATDAGRGTIRSDVDDRPITPQERQRAENYKRAIGYCPHDPKCETSATCTGLLVRGWREQERAALRA